MTFYVWEILYTNARIELQIKFLIHVTIQINNSFLFRIIVSSVHRLL